MSNYSDHELQEQGIHFRSNVSIHKSVKIFDAPNFDIGNNVRIDCFSLITCGDQGTFIGSHIRVAAGALYLRRRKSNVA